MRIDHLILGAADLKSGVEFLEARCGIWPAPGGKHPRWGTRNALADLGSGRYLEVLAPDPESTAHTEPRPFEIEHLPTPRLVTWVASGDDFDACVSAARTAGVDLGEVGAGTRETADGRVLRWRMTDLAKPREGGVLPFLIDWGDSPHPSAGLPAGCTLLELAAEHPDPERVTKRLRAMGLSLPVVHGTAPALIATLETPRGIVHLR